MSSKRKYLEEKYKYLLLKKQYKNLIGGAAKTDDLFENQRLCFIETKDFDKAKSEPILVLTDADRELAKTRPGEIMWELTDPSKLYYGKENSIDTNKIDFLKNLQPSDLKLYNRQVNSGFNPIGCGFKDAITIESDYFTDKKIVDEKITLNNNRAAEWCSLDSREAFFTINTTRGILGISRPDWDFKTPSRNYEGEVLGFVNWQPGWNESGENYRILEFIVLIDEKDSTNVKFIQWLDGKVQELGITVNSDGSLSLTKNPTVFTVAGLSGIETVSSTPPPPSIFKPIGCGFKDAITIESDYFTDKKIVDEKITLNNNRAAEWCSLDSREAFFTINTTRGILGISRPDWDFKTPSRNYEGEVLGFVNWQPGWNESGENYRILEFIVLIDEKDSTNVKFIQWLDGKVQELGITVNSDGSLSLTKNPTVFTVAGLSGIETASSTPVCDENSQHTLVIIKGNPWDDKFRIDRVENYLQLSNETDYSQEVIAHFRRDHTTFPVIDIRSYSGSGNPNGPLSYNTAGHMDAHIQNLVIDGYPSMFIIYNLLTTMFQEQFNLWLRNKLGSNYTSFDAYNGKSPWDRGTSQSHTYCPLINHFIKQKMPELLTPDARAALIGPNLYTAGGEYQQFKYDINHNDDNPDYRSTYTLADGSEIPINGNFNPLENAVAQGRFQEILNIMDDLIDPNTGVSFKRYLTYMLHYYPAPSESIPVGWKYRINADRGYKVCPAPSWKPIQRTQSANIWSQETRSYDYNDNSHPITLYIRPSIYMLMIRSRDINATFEGANPIVTRLLSGDPALVTPIVTPCLADHGNFMDTYDSLYKYDERATKYNKTPHNAQNSFRISYAPHVVPPIDITPATFNLATSLNTMKAIEYSFKGNTMELL